MNDFGEESDVVVVGGGPGGATVSALIAMSGHKVLLLDRDEFPRHQIGESLLPSTIHGICPLLGVSDEIHGAGFMRKHGGTFRWGKSVQPWTFSFADSSRTAGPTSFAYQVERSKFDAILLNNARRKGVQVRERARATNVLTEHGRVAGVRWVDAAAQSHTVRTKYVVDASGNESMLFENVGKRVYSEFFQNVAIYGYFRGGKRLPKPNSGNILSAAFKKGWFWYIPLSDTLTSVGAVVSQDQMSVIQRGHSQALDTFISACPLIREYLSGAERVTEGQYGKLRVRKDYSYCCTRFWAPGMVLVGDAACFVDPVFSSGVHLATYSGLLAARSINSCLRGDVEESRSFSEFETRYLREYANFYRFLVAFYDLHQDEESYFWAARKLLGSAEQGNEAFVSLVAGLGVSGEPLFGSTDEFFESIGTLSNSFQRAQSAPGVFTKNALNREFMNALTQEGMRLQMRSAFLPDEAETESPVWERGLIPTADGRHWCEPPT